MAADREKKFSHSKMLFKTDEGLPMIFIIRPSEDKARLSNLVKHGGGTVTSKKPEGNDHYISLYIEGDKAIPANAVKVQYVDDCVDQNQQLDIEQYRVPKDAAIVKTNGTSTSPSTSVISTTSTVKGRSAYTNEEDEAILSYIAKFPNSYRGNKIWKKMEMMKITNHSWQSMRDRFGKKLESYLPGYIEKYKAGVLKKFGFTSSESNTEDEKGNESNGAPNQKKNAKNKNANNNGEIEQFSDDSDFDTSLINVAVENKQIPGKSKTSHKDKPKTVAGKQGSDSSDNREHNKKVNSNHSHNKGDNARDTRSQRNQLQDENEQIQCSRVTRSSETLKSPAKTTKNASKRKPVQSEESEPEITHNTRSKRKCESPKKLHPPKPKDSSEDTEGKDTLEESESSPLRRKTRQARNIRKSSRKKRVVEDSSSSSDDDDEDVKLVSHKTQRLDRATIDKIINEKSPGEKSISDIFVSGDDDDDDDDDAETQVIEVKDSLPDSQEDDQPIEALDEDVDAIQGIMSDFEISAEAALYAVYMNSGNIEATYHYIKTGKPPDGHTVWMKSDDRKLNSSNPEDIRKLVKKYGQEAVTGRQQYLNS